mmetsp:Transcript_20816/g.42849  ORF Transcript_20816/g.42849 Transcript_20816/m.42849 type:complete len:203 (-) Transcript_20816:1340-1948(-)
MPPKLSVFVLQDPRRTTHCRYIFLRRRTACRLFVPRVHHAIPLPVRGSVNDILFGVHDSEDRPPLSTGWVAAADPLVGFLGGTGHRAFLSAGQRRQTGFVLLVALEASHPDPQVLTRAGIGRRFGSVGGVVFFFGRRTAGTLWIVAIHGTVPLLGELAVVDYPAETSPLFALVAFHPGGIGGTCGLAKDASFVAFHVHSLIQ